MFQGLTETSMRPFFFKLGLALAPACLLALTKSEIAQAPRRRTRAQPAPSRPDPIVEVGVNNVVGEDDTGVASRIGCMVSGTIVIGGSVERDDRLGPAIGLGRLGRGGKLFRDFTYKMA